MTAGHFSRLRSWRLPVISTPLVGGVHRGVIASLCLLAHGALLLPFVRITAAPRLLPNGAVVAAEGSGDSDQQSLDWITLDQQTSPAPPAGPSELLAFHPRPVHGLDALSRAALALEIRTPEISAEEGPDDGKMARLYERYIDQITGLIERAWIRPRTPIGSPSFSCQAQVVQDATGKILEIMLEQCNGNARWQVSLVQAIQSASPLPAPPPTESPSGTLQLGFTAEVPSEADTAESDTAEPTTSSDVRSTQN
jgi:hypothetical protein